MTIAKRAREAKSEGAARRGVVKRARACLAAVLLAVIGAAAVSDCAEMTSGECADKASCAESDGGPGSSANDAASGVDSLPGPDAQDVGLDATSTNDSVGPVDGVSADATTDSAGGGAVDATNRSEDQIVPGADADAADARSPQDGSVTPSGEGGPDGGPDAACPAPPTGWTFALLEDVADGGACPAGWTVQDGFTQPTFGVGACQCSCTVTQAPDCNAGTLSPRMGGTNTTCTQPWFSVAVQGTACSPITGGPTSTLPGNVATSPLPAQGGACTGSPQMDPSQLSASSVRYCAAMPSGDSVCDPPGPGFSACIMSPGEVACPAGTPFVNAHVVAAQVSLACAACSACSVTGTCSNAAFTTYGDTACTINLVGFAANGACNDIGLPLAPGTTVGAVAYRASLAQSSCTAGTSTPSAQLANAVTLCCQ